MDKDLLIQLTNNIYRLTLFFPKKEPLRYKMRQVSTEILNNFLKINFEQGKDSSKYISLVYANLEVLDSFFEVALIQKWVSPFDVLAVKKEYDNLRQEFKNKKPEEKPQPVKQVQQKEITPFKSQKVINAVNQRQEKILQFLKENGQAQVWQVKEIMPDITKRTLRRDFEHMLEQGLIQRIGEKNNTFYQIKTD